MVDFTVDIEGYTLKLNDRVLFKEHVPFYKKLLNKIFPKWKKFQTNNGVYTVTQVGDNSEPWKLSSHEDILESKELHILSEQEQTYLRKHWVDIDEEYPHYTNIIIRTEGGEDVPAEYQEGDFYSKLTGEKILDAEYWTTYQDYISYENYKGLV